MLKAAYIKLTNALRSMPLPADRWLGDAVRMFSRTRYRAYVRKMVRGSVIDVDDGPAPPHSIVMRTAILREEDIPIRCDPNYYFISGQSQLLNWLRILEQHGFDIAHTNNIMELGCGSARLIRHLRCIEGVRLVGCDIHEASIDWCCKNVGGIEFYRNIMMPPLEFAADGEFDLILASSVFTHIPLDTQHEWLAEIKRVLTPHGYFIADLHGDYHRRMMLSEAENQDLERSGELTLTSSASNVSVSTQVADSYDVFQTRSKALENFGAFFEVNLVPQAGLHLMVCRNACSAGSSPV